MHTLKYTVAQLDTVSDSPPLPAQLRDIFRQDRWYRSSELVALLGHRFAASLYTVRNGGDGKPPMHILAQRVPGSHEWMYRWDGTYLAPEVRERCDKCGHVLARRRK